MKLKILVILITSFVPQALSYDFERTFFEHSIILDAPTNVLSRSFDESTCDDQLTLFNDALENRELWALKRKIFNLVFKGKKKNLFLSLVFDTWAKIDSGYLVYNLISIGHYSECLRFRHESVQGQHCLVAFRATDASSITEPTESGFDWREV